MYVTDRLLFLCPFKLFVIGVKMTNEIMKFNYNSSHNNFPAIESLNPIDIGTERQFRFTAKMLCDMFQITKPTLYSRVETLVNVGDLSVKNSLQIKIPDSNGRSHETTIYDLTVLNKLAMTMIDNPIAVNVRKAFNDVIVQVETTGQYNTKPVVPQTYLEALKALVASEEEKEQLKLTNENLTTELTEVSKQRDKAIQTKQQISDSKTAKALGRVGGLVTANNRLKDELYLNRNYRTIGAIAQLNGISENSLNWRLLKSYCNEHDLEVMKIQGVRFQINVYPIEAFRAIYPELRVD